MNDSTPKTEMLMNRYDVEHMKKISSYLRMIDEAYRVATNEMARLVISSKAEYDPEKVFSFDHYPSVRRRVDRVASTLSSKIEMVIVNGIKAQWNLSNRKNDELVETVTGHAAEEFPDELRKRYFATNENALDAFIEQTRDRIDLSMKVWKREMELGADVSLKKLQDEIENGITEGMDAIGLSHQLRDYLKYPNLLFRRVQDERGVLTISRNAAVFHPGTGVYRSSYMNTRRFVATETNMAYRSADHERWKNLDFVVGIEIQTSNNHTTKDGTGNTVELRDICDTLAGRYPKDFKFVGWHPLCRCIATTILKTEAEMAKDTERILNGEEPLPPKDSANYIENVPEKFSRWVVKNTKRIEVARKKGSLPYFLADNEKYVDEAIPATLRHLYETMAKYQYIDPNLKSKEARINAKMKELFDNNDFGLEIKHEYLKDVIEDGFKNMFELGRDHSYSKPGSNFGQIDTDSERLVISHRMYGIFGMKGLSSPTDQEQKYTGKQLARSGYEKYGHVLDKDKTKSYSVNGATKYGDVQVRFKKDMVNCTWTFDDSLKTNGAYYQPSLTSDPRIESFDRLYKGSADDLLNNTNWDSLTDWILKNDTRYIELQYHGRLTIDCVESMIFPSDPKVLIGEEIVEKLMGKGAELWYMKDGKIIQYRP